MREESETEREREELELERERERKREIIDWQNDKTYRKTEREKGKVK